MRKIILASTSPRRKEIFEKAGIPFSIEDSGYEEDLSLPLEPRELAKQLALQKVRMAAGRHKDAVVIGADTIVVVHDRILGKPKDLDEAADMLKLLRGSTNTVITGIAIVDTKSGKNIARTEETKVHFKKLADKEIAEYVATGEPMGKAGAYAVQGLGASLIDKIDGDFHNAMGLPLAVLLEELEKFGIISYTQPPLENEFHAR